MCGKEGGKSHRRRNCSVVVMAGKEKICLDKKYMTLMNRKPNSFCVWLPILCFH